VAGGLHQSWAATTGYKNNSPSPQCQLAKSRTLSKFLYSLDPNVVVAQEKYEQRYRRLVKYFECNRCTDAVSIRLPRHAPIAG
jgi:hypothetical protein